MWHWWPWHRAQPCLTDALWSEVAQQLPYLHCLPGSDAARLRALTDRFLAAKIFEGAQGMVITDRVRAEIAAQACLLILNLDLDFYKGWQTIIVYPGDFRVNKEFVDADGIVHHWTEALSGESWEQGPVILSWEAATSQSGDINIVLHEFAHKLDMRDGTANGCPPLHPGMSPQAWHAALAAAYSEFQQALEQGGMPWLDEYAAESPAEFFAVLSEMFFLSPGDFRRDLPAAYEQLKAFYGQDPQAVLGATPQVVIADRF